MNYAADDSRKALRILRQHFVSTEKPRVRALYEELTALRMKENKDLTDYMIQVERAVTALHTDDESITDILIITMILKGLPETFKPFVVVHTQLDTVKTLTDFISALNNYGSAETMRNEGQGTAALATHVRQQAFLNKPQYNRQKSTAIGENTHN